MGLEQKILGIDCSVSAIQREAAGLHDHVEEIWGRTHCLEKTFKTLVKDLDQCDNELLDLQVNVENIDNQVRKNNICLKGLKEGVEWDRLKTYLEELFTGYARSDSSVEIKIVQASRINYASKNKSETA